ncbi:DUF1778 domain-containing protein [Romboutsia weinsteinii]|uniref:DUF1778 domain-containing protein n=1 Tax=Romboutsia weinsteinii TaxID=2020949 RepID=A0A371JAT0_9FIRM|nr:DUF1778 domain-containing protein [Romboutsia weinsteinii]RDY29768.1 DUF1778 domain-containing protein [Romboutsia weinsteinii]
MAVDRTKNDRLGITVTKELHQLIKEYAQLENRKVSNFIVNAIVEYLKSKYKIEL